MYGEPPKCRKCGQIIRFIRTKNGKQMPVDGFSVNVIPGTAGALFFLPDGTTIRGRETDTTGPKSVKASRSHFATCPYADELRKPKDGQREAERKKIRERIEKERAEEEARRIRRETKAREEAEQREAREAQTSLFRNET